MHEDARFRFKNLFLIFGKIGQKYKISHFTKFKIRLKVCENIFNCVGLTKPLVLVLKQVRFTYEIWIKIILTKCLRNTGRDWQWWAPSTQFFASVTRTSTRISAGGELLTFPSKEALLCNIFAVLLFFLLLLLSLLCKIKKSKVYNSWKLACYTVVWKIILIHIWSWDAYAPFI